MSFTDNWKKAIIEAGDYINQAEWLFKRTSKRKTYRRINYYLTAKQYLIELNKHQTIENIKDLARIKFLSKDKRVKAFNVILNYPIAYQYTNKFKQALYVVFRIDREYNVKFDIKQNNFKIDLKFGGN